MTANATAPDGRRRRLSRQSVRPHTSSDRDPEGVAGGVGWSMARDQQAKSSPKYLLQISKIKSEFRSKVKVQNEFFSSKFFKISKNPIFFLFRAETRRTFTQAGGSLGGNDLSQS